MNKVEDKLKYSSRQSLKHKYTGKLSILGKSGLSRSPPGIQSHHVALQARGLGHRA